MLGTYLLVSALVLPAASRIRAGDDFPEKLAQYPDAHIGFYQTYSTGSVFYGGPITTKVILPEEAPSLNGGANWNLKYVMPLETADKFAQPHEGTTRNLLFLPKSKEKIFNEKSAPSIEATLIETYEKYLILEVKPKNKGGTP